MLELRPRWERAAEVGLTAREIGLAMDLEGAEWLVINGMKKSSDAISIVTHKEERVASLKATYPFTSVRFEETVDISDKVVILAVKPQMYQTVKTKGRAKAPTLED